MLQFEDDGEPEACAGIGAPVLEIGAADVGEAEGEEQARGDQEVVEPVEWDGVPAMVLEGVERRQAASSVGLNRERARDEQMGEAVAQQGCFGGDDLAPQMGLF